MKSNLLLPFYLTKETGLISIEQAVKSAFIKIPDLKERKTLHIVVLVEAMDISGEYPNYPLVPVVLAEKSYNKENWGHEFDEIAQCKALQKYHERNHNDFGFETPAHLLYTGDTHWYGAVKLQRITVACSGDTETNDTKISQIVAEACISNAKRNWIKSDCYKDQEDFVTKDNSYYSKEINELLNTPVYDLDDLLQSMKITLTRGYKLDWKLKDVLDLSKREILTLKDFGPKKLEKFNEFLERNHLSDYLIN